MKARQEKIRQTVPGMRRVKQIHFVGIGGAGMGGIAEVLLNEGYIVTGSDISESAVTNRLISLGAKIYFSHEAGNIENANVVVVSSAIKEDNVEVQTAREKRIPVIQRAQMLAELMRFRHGIAIAGTHGKTTTSAMCAHIMHQSHVDCNAFLGGISKNYGTNYILSDHSDYVVIEADEFDRSFHWLRPWMSVITSTDPDHLDIYGTKEAYLESFRHYTELIQKGGALILHKRLEMKQHVQEGVKVYEYSRNDGDFHAENVRIADGTITFDFISPIENVKDVELGQPIPINIENGIAAMAMAQLNGCTTDELRRGMKTYGGVDRRFDFKIKNSRHVFLSDYAHHPKEILQSAKSLKELYPDRKVTVIFQPHLYSRTRDFYKDFAGALSHFDEVILTEIYPAREDPIPGVTSSLIYDNLRPGVEKQMIKKDDVLDFVRSRDFDVLVVLGAGNLDNYVPQITELLNGK